MASLLPAREKSGTTYAGRRDRLIDVEALVREYGIPAWIARVFDRKRVGHSVREQLHPETVGHFAQTGEAIERFVIAATGAPEAALQSLRPVDVSRQLECSLAPNAVRARLELIVEALPPRGLGLGLGRARHRYQKKSGKSD
jgi:hypothetical protein